MDLLKQRLANLLTIKSIVTVVLTAVFACMTATGEIHQEFMTIYTVVIAFYFGTQAEKRTGGGHGTGK